MAFLLFVACGMFIDMRGGTLTVSPLTQDVLGKTWLFEHSTHLELKK